MKFSVVTAAYNAADTISRTIESVQLQTCHEVEHIIVDGLSSDGTDNVVRSVGEHCVLIREQDGGIFDAMNKGIRVATGDVVSILNSDDFYSHRNVLSLVADRMHKGTIDGVFGDVGFFNANRPDIIVRRYRSIDFTPNRLRFGIMPAHPGMFLRREIYSRFGLYDTTYTIASDFEFVARLFAQGGINYRMLNEIVVSMQTGGASTRNLKSKMTIFRECLNACRKNGIATNVALMLLKYPLKASQFFSHANSHVEAS